MYKEKLIDLLKSDKEIKMKMEKLEFGCKVYNEQTDTFGLVTWVDGMDFNWTEDNYEHCISHYSIIRLPLQEKFIRMYCNNKGLFISFDNKNIYLQFRILLENNENLTYTIDFNNTKDFDNQSEEVYKEIYEALYNLNK